RQVVVAVDARQRAAARDLDRAVERRASREHLPVERVAEGAVGQRLHVTRPVWHWTNFLASRRLRKSTMSCRAWSGSTSYSVQTGPTMSATLTGCASMAHTLDPTSLRV